LGAAVVALGVAALAVGGAGPAGARVTPRPSHTWVSPALDGLIQARPVVVGTTVVVATQNNSLYGLSLGDGRILWGPRHVGPPISLADIAALSPSAAGCGNVDPIGIIGSPAVDPGTGRVFAVAEVATRPGHPPVHELVGVDAATGQVVVGPTPIDPPSMLHPELEEQRAGLTVANGNVYVAFGGLFGDCGEYHGFVVAAREDGSGIAGYFEDTNGVQGNRQGGIRGTGPLPVDAYGNVYAATGNAENSPPPPLTDDSQAVIRLGPTPSFSLDFFQPVTFQAENASGLDLGSTSPLLVGDGQIFQIGKQRNAYLLDAADLGGADHHTPLASLDNLCLAMGSNAVLGSSVFVACQGGVQQVLIDRSGSVPQLRHGWTAPVPAGGPVVVGAGWVWSVDTADGVLDAMNPITGKVVAHDSVSLDASQQFPTPTVAAPSVLVAAGDHVDAFALPVVRPRRAR
jgi:outer membrane protein assembly factor BamB